MITAIIIMILVVIALSYLLSLLPGCNLNISGNIPETLAVAHSNTKVHSYSSQSLFASYAIFTTSSASSERA